MFSEYEESLCLLLTSASACVSQVAVLLARLRQSRVQLGSQSANLLCSHSHTVPLHYTVSRVQFFNVDIDVHQYSQCSKVLLVEITFNDLHTSD